MCPALIQIYILAPILVFLVIFLAFRFFARKSFEQNFVQAYGGKYSWFKNKWVTDVDGIPVSFVYKPNRKNRPSSLQISLTGGFFAHAVFRTETQADRFGKDIGFNDEIQVSDLSFDNAVYVECEDRDFITGLLGSAEVKKHIQGILKDMTSLEINGNRCAVIKTPCNDLTQFDANELMATACAMLAFAQKIPLPGPGMCSATPLTDECRRWTRFFIGFAVALSGTGLVLTLWGLKAFVPVMPWSFFETSLYVSIPLGFILIFYMFNQFKGLSVALHSFIPGASFGLIGVVLVCWGGGMVINGSQDVSNAVSHQVNVVEKYITHSKNSKAFRIRVKAWHSEFPNYGFMVSPQVYDRVNVGDSCTVVSKAGLLGFEWVASHVCYPAGS
jgi:hypothetical protein